VLKTFVPLAGPLCLVLGLAATAGAQTSAATGTLIVTVVDQSGGVLPMAMVTMTGQEDATRRTALAPAIASDLGQASIDALVPGRYTLLVEFPGFEPQTVRDVRVRTGENRRTVTLRLMAVTEDVEVTRDVQSAGLDPMGLAFSTILTREMIEALPDDPEEMAAVLDAMSPPGARIRVDGFSGGMLPHKSQIKSIRLPRMDAMAAQNHGGKDGFLFIDIKTQPGAGPMRGSVNGAFYDDVFGANNLFTPKKGGEQTRQYGTSLAGTIIPNKASFSANFGGTSQYTSPNLMAVLADGSTLAQSLQRPSELMNLGLRIDFALNPDHSVRVSFDRHTRETRNQGTGGFNLLDRAFTSNNTTNVLRVAESGPVGRRMYSESRLQLSWVSSASTAAVEAPTIRVVDAFTSGGAQVTGGQHQFEIEAASDLDYVRGLHSWRVGALVEGGRYRSDDTSNYLGTYTFASLEAFRAGMPSAYSRRIGDPNITYASWNIGAYVQDDWRVARSVLLSVGVRAGYQTLVRDPLNISPRMTVGWSPMRDGKMTLRASYGYLYDWVPGGLYKQSQLVDGVRLREINVTLPSYPDPPSTGVASATNRYLWSDDLTLPNGHRLSLGADRQLMANMRVNVSYTWSWDRGEQRGRNLNAPVNGVRPDPTFANVVELVSDAESKLHSVNVGWNYMKLNWKRAFFSANYTWTDSKGNGTGAFALPANGDNLATEWAPTRATHVANASVNITLIAGLNVNLNATSRSGSPYNITTGQDNNRDGLFNDRPEGLPRNSARTAARWDLNGRVGYTWRFGPPFPNATAAKPLGRRTVNVSLQFQNLLNRSNFVGYSGVRTSPFFMQPTNVANPRRVQLSMKFGF